MAANKIHLIPFILKWEGGFSNDPNDPGGATMKGITLATFRSYRAKYNKPMPSVTDLKNISDQEWQAIFTEGYWNPWKAHLINSQAVADLLVGTGWGSGPVTAIKYFQKHVGLTVDGIVGPKTLEYINIQCEYSLFNRLWMMRANWFIDIVNNKPTSKGFLKGWLNRLYDNVPYLYHRHLENNNVLVPIVSKLNPTALKEIQKFIGTTVDGKYGPNTQAKLLAYPSESALKLFDLSWLKLKDQYVQEYINGSIPAAELKKRLAIIYGVAASMSKKEKFE